MKNKFKKPNFLVIAPLKSGTSSIANYLKEHPEIFIPKVKEPFYFTSEVIKRISKDDQCLIL